MEYHWNSWTVLFLFTSETSTSLLESCHFNGDAFYVNITIILHVASHAMFRKKENVSRKPRNAYVATFELNCVFNESRRSGFRSAFSSGRILNEVT